MLKYSCMYDCENDIMDDTKIIKKLCATDVYFKELTNEMIKEYLSYNEWQDKAGAYGIQGKGAVLVEKLDGCYNNVVGLPLTRVYEILAELGIRPSTGIIDTFVPGSLTEAEASFAS